MQLLICLFQMLLLIFRFFFIVCATTAKYHEPLSLTKINESSEEVELILGHPFCLMFSCLRVSTVFFLSPYVHTKSLSVCTSCHQLRCHPNPLYVVIKTHLFYSYTLYYGNLSYDFSMQILVVHNSTYPCCVFNKSQTD